MRGGYSPLHAAAANSSTECLQDLIDAGSSLRHSASESSLRGGSATALELAEESKQPAAASMLRNASVSEFEVWDVGKTGCLRRGSARVPLRFPVRKRYAMREIYETTSPPSQ